MFWRWLEVVLPSPFPPSVWIFPEPSFEELINFPPDERLFSPSALGEVAAGRQPESSFQAFQDPHTATYNGLIHIMGQSGILAPGF